jgi:tetratricopeptide (TPR) repeat protein
MSAKAIIAAVVVVIVGIAGVILMLTSGRGTTVYVPDDAARHREKGEFLLNKRRHTTNQQKKAELLTQAISEFKAALKSKPDFEVAHNMLGHCYIERGQWEDALKNLNQALEIRPDYPAARFNRGRVYQRLSVGKRDHKYIDMAIADYQAALKSELAANFVGDLHKVLADAYHQKGDLKKAIEELKIYLKKAPHAQDAVLVRRKIRGLQLMEKGTAPPLNAPLD